MACWLDIKFFNVPSPVGGRREIQKITTLESTCRWFWRHWFTWEHFVTISCVRYEACHDHGGLHHVAFLDFVENIDVSVMGASEVIHRFLDELEARYADCVKTYVVGAAGFFHRGCFGTKVMEWG